jgi:23S rRNA (cytidine1920-2'-O)/16S rRNA (cytidine1409-2'-O)-methyltransferase
MGPRRRLDSELVRRGLAPSRTQAQEAVLSGKVTVGGAPADRPARLVAPGEPIEVAGPSSPFVGRGGHKLEAALDRFGVDVTGLRTLDAGASTGGFTDCLLQRGAARVVALDVGHGQLDIGLRNDPRVEVRERTNVRDLVLDAPVDLVTADLSFISLVSVLDSLIGATRPEGHLIALVKPQFEAGRREADRGRGVITDPSVWRQVLQRVIAAFDGRGASIMGVMASPLKGANGNVEFFVHARVSASPGTDDVERAVDAALTEAGLL